MMAHNLCYTTLLDKGTVEKLGLVKDVDYTQTPNNGTLRRSSVAFVLPLCGLCRLVCQAIKEARSPTHDLGRLDLCQEESQGGLEERDGSVQKGRTGWQAARPEGLRASIPWILEG